MMSIQTVLIDGRSGSGKTTFATRFAQLTGFEVVHMDDFYPGWGGLAAGIEMLVEHVLHPTSPGFIRWDWVRNQPGKWVSLESNVPRIVEGVGAVGEASLSAAHQLGAVLSIRLNVADELRKQRALARDPGYAQWWDMWAAQEERLVRVPVDFELE